MRPPSGRLCGTCAVWVRNGDWHTCQDAKLDKAKARVAASVSRMQAMIDSLHGNAPTDDDE